MLCKSKRNCLFSNWGKRSGSFYVKGKRQEKEFPNDRRLSWSCAKKLQIKLSRWASGISWVGSLTVIITPSNVNHRFWPISSCVDNMSPLTLTWRWRDSSFFRLILWVFFFLFFNYKLMCVIFVCFLHRSTKITLKCDPKGSGKGNMSLFHETRVPELRASVYVNIYSLLTMSWAPSPP